MYTASLALAVANELAPPHIISALNARVRVSSACRLERKGTFIRVFQQIIWSKWLLRRRAEGDSQARRLSVLAIMPPGTGLLAQIPSDLRFATRYKNN